MYSLPTAVPCLAWHLARLQPLLLLLLQESSLANICIHSCPGLHRFVITPAHNTPDTVMWAQKCFLFQWLGTAGSYITLHCTGWAAQITWDFLRPSAYWEPGFHIITTNISNIQYTYMEQTILMGAIQKSGQGKSPQRGREITHCLAMVTIFFISDGKMVFLSKSLD